MNPNCKEFIRQLPKAELHVHIEGTMEPEQYLQCAQRNNINIPYTTPDQARAAYQFSNYQTFVDAYIKLTAVICTEQDFYDLTIAYLRKMAQQGVLHTEIFFDFQSYAPRNIAPAIIVHGIFNALTDGQKQFGISGGMIMCFLRHLPEEDALKTFERALPFKEKIMGVGLATVETGNPPSKFKRVFAQAKAAGFHRVAHVAEGGGPEVIWQALQELDIERIDHGIAAIKDSKLVAELVQKKIPLTVCPFSNVAVLHEFPTLQSHPLKKMYDAGLRVTINSDDPAFFGSNYIAENYYAAAERMGFTCPELVECARNSFLSAFCSDERKQVCLAMLEAYAKGHQCD